MKRTTPNEKKEKLEKQLERVNKYFILTPEKPGYLAQQLLMITGAVLLLFAASGKPIGFLSGVIGLLLLLIGFSKWGNKKSEYRKLYNKAEPKATDNEMDDLLEKGKQEAIKQAYERLDIKEKDNASTPLLIDGPDNNSLIGLGKDKVLRFRHHNILIFFLTKHNIATFHCILDLGCSEILKDKTKEFPYKDITNLETETNNETFYYSDKQKLSVDGVKTLSVYTSGGNATTVNYIFSKETGDEEYKLPPSDAEKNIRAIRTKLKEYKDRTLNQKEES